MRKRGFTFIEILVAVTIMAVLMAIGIASYASVNKRARDAKRKSDLEQIRSALEQYRADIGSYPTEGGGWKLSTSGSSWISALVPAYMDDVPVDPKNTGTGLGDTRPVYMYFSGVISGCLASGGREYIVAAQLETSETKTTRYGTCDWRQAGWYALGEK